ncbi:Uncharacterised protein [Mycobacterium tuberculosis]|nr:Uncharacterised protein [Mycobacterium tuberculosis]
MDRLDPGLAATAREVAGELDARYPRSRQDDSPGRRGRMRTE